MNNGDLLGANIKTSSDREGSACREGQLWSCQTVYVDVFWLPKSSSSSEWRSDPWSLQVWSHYTCILLKDLKVLMSFAPFAAALAEKKWTSLLLRVVTCLVLGQTVWFWNVMSALSRMLVCPLFDTFSHDVSWMNKEAWTQKKSNVLTNWFCLILKQFTWTAGLYDALVMK